MNFAMASTPAGGLGHRLRRCLPCSSCLQPVELSDAALAECVMMRHSRCEVHRNLCLGWRLLLQRQLVRRCNATTLPPATLSFMKWQRIAAGRVLRMHLLSLAPALHKCPRERITGFRRWHQASIARGHAVEAGRRVVRQWLGRLKSHGFRQWAELGAARRSALAMGARVMRVWLARSVRAGFVRWCEACASRHTARALMQRALRTWQRQELRSGFAAFAFASASSREVQARRGMVRRVVKRWQRMEITGCWERWLTRWNATVLRTTRMTRAGRAWREYARHAAWRKLASIARSAATIRSVLRTWRVREMESGFWQWHQASIARGHAVEAGQRVVRQWLGRLKSHGFRQWAELCAARRSALAVGEQVVRIWRAREAQAALCTWTDVWRRDSERARISRHLTSRALRRKRFACWRLLLDACQRESERMRTAEQCMACALRHGLTAAWRGLLHATASARASSEAEVRAAATLLTWRFAGCHHFRRWRRRALPLRPIALRLLRTRRLRRMSCLWLRWQRIASYCRRNIRQTHAEFLHRRRLLHGRVPSPRVDLADVDAIVATDMMRHASPRGRSFPPRAPQVRPLTAWNDNNHASHTSSDVNVWPRRPEITCFPRDEDVRRLTPPRSRHAVELDSPSPVPCIDGENDPTLRLAFDSPRAHAPSVTPPSLSPRGAPTGSPRTTPPKTPVKSPMRAVGTSALRATQSTTVHFPRKPSPVSPILCDQAVVHRRLVGQRVHSRPWRGLSSSLPPSSPSPQRRSSAAVSPARRLRTSPKPTPSRRDVGRPENGTPALARWTATAIAEGLRF